MTLTIGTLRAEPARRRAGACPPIKQPVVQPRDWVWTGDVESPAAGLWYPDAVTGDEVTEGLTAASAKHLLASR